MLFSLSLNSFWNAVLIWLSALPTDSVDSEYNFLLIEPIPPQCLEFLEGLMRDFPPVILDAMVVRDRFLGVVVGDAVG
jgi:hypothetical protein